MIEVNELTKTIAGSPVLTGVTFSARPGSIVGLLGPNGAGKTTTLRILAGVLLPTGGSCSISGLDIRTRQREICRLIGYLPEVPPLYPEMRVSEYLRFVAAIRDVPRRRISAAIDSVIDLCGLQSVSRRLCGQLSRGFKQRVGIAQAILNEPPLLLLDEPTNGLDPLQLIEFRRLLKQFSGRHTVLLSTHLLAEVEEVCSDVVFFSAGRTVGQSSVEGGVSRRDLEERYFHLIAGPAAAAAEPRAVNC